MVEQLGLCGTWLETLNTGFLTTRLINVCIGGSYVRLAFILNTLTTLNIEIIIIILHIYNQGKLIYITYLSLPVMLLPIPVLFVERLDDSNICRLFLVADGH